MTVLPLLLSAILTAGQPADSKSDADNTSRAKETFQYAQKLYKQARYQEAIAKFEEAYTLRPHPVIYFNIGRCYEQLNETAKALRAYKDYLRLAPDAKDRDTVSDAMANLERRLKERGVQQLLVYAEPSNAHIEVDGKELGTSPASAEIQAGNHKLVVRADGFETVDRAFVMTLTRSIEMTITLRPVAATPPVAKAEPAKDAPRQEPAAKLAPDAASNPKPQVTAAPEAAPRKRVFTWVAGGAAVAALGAGIGMGAVASANSQELLSMPHEQMKAQSLHDTAQSMSLGANVAYATAGAAAITAVVLFFVEGR